MEPISFFCLWISLSVNSLQVAPRRLQKKSAKNQISPPYIGRGIECSSAWRSAAPAHEAKGRFNNPNIHQSKIKIQNSKMGGPPNPSEPIRTPKKYFFF
jgi:hypothetical protein